MEGNLSPRGLTPVRGLNLRTPVCEANAVPLLHLELLLNGKNLTKLSSLKIHLISHSYFCRREVMIAFLIGFRKSLTALKSNTICENFEKKSKGM